MKILLYGINYAPEQTGIGKYSGEMGAWLAARGHDVRVITAPPYYPEWKIGAGYSAWSYRTEKMGGVTVFRCPLWVPKKVTGSARIVHLASFALSSLPVAMRNIFWRPDVVFTLEPPFFCAPAAVLTAACSGATSWLHVQDFEVDAALELGVLKLPGLKSLVLWMEKFITRRFRVRSTISKRMMERLEQKAGTSDGNVFFPNWVDVDAIYPLDRQSVFRDELGLSAETKVAVYSGNMGMKQGLEIVIEAARLLKDRSDLKFIMCGAGAAYETLRKQAEGLENIIWMPLQPFEKLNDLLNLADLHLLPQRADAADLVMPSKLTGMLASGRPVLATALPGTQVYELVEKVGKVVPPTNEQAFAEAILELIDAPQGSKELGLNARRIAVEELAIGPILQKFEETLVATRSLRRARVPVQETR